MVNAVSLLVKAASAKLHAELFLDQGSMKGECQNALTDTITTNRTDQNAKEVWTALKVVGMCGYAFGGVNNSAAFVKGLVGQFKWRMLAKRFPD